MRALVVGGGGREHALAWKLAQSPSVDALYAAPGNAGIEEVATCVPIEPTDLHAIVDLVDRQRIDLTVIGPDAAVVAGLADELEAKGFRAFGPSKAAARIEGSKSWAKDVCRRHGIPTGRAEAFTSPEEAISYLGKVESPYVVKADGLAAGKGVTIATTRREAEQAIRRAMVDRAFGPSGERVLIEEFLEGREVSAFALTDGERVVPLAFAQDFKRAGDGDLGPNTGGMGAYSPVPWVDEGNGARIFSDIMEGTVRALAREGIPYRGCLYGGLILTSDGPKVLEFNSRFGDPETQTVLPRFRGDLAAALAACVDGTLTPDAVGWAQEACVTVVLASGGYPGPHRTGIEVRGLEEAGKTDKAVVFHAGTGRRDGRVVTAGGRVLAVSALGTDLAEARRRAYEACARISFEGMHHRTDIAKEAAGG
ncbi:MAG: phosphoribosylamine--glycine ligase [Actinomycetota bacterium]